MTERRRTVADETADDPCARPEAARSPPGSAGPDAGGVADQADRLLRAVGRAGGHDAALVRFRHYHADAAGGLVEADTIVATPAAWATSAEAAQCRGDGAPRWGVVALGPFVMAQLLVRAGPDPPGRAAGGGPR
jgi:hypothetical protein